MEGVDIAWPDFSLVYMTPLLQHLAQLDRNTTLANHRVAYASANKVGYFLKILRLLLYFYFQL